VGGAVLVGGARFLPQSGGDLSAIDAIAENGCAGVLRTRWQSKVFWDAVGRI
jgi:hypothetical protein